MRVQQRYNERDATVKSDCGQGNDNWKARRRTAKRKECLKN